MRIQARLKWCSQHFLTVQLPGIPGSIHLHFLQFFRASWKCNSGPSGMADIGWHFAGNSGAVNLWPKGRSWAMQRLVCMLRETMMPTFAYRSQQSTAKWHDVATAVICQYLQWAGCLSPYVQSFWIFQKVSHILSLLYIIIINPMPWNSKPSDWQSGLSHICERANWLCKLDAAREWPRVSQVLDRKSGKTGEESLARRSWITQAGIGRKLDTSHGIVVCFSLRWLAGKSKPPLTAKAGQSARNFSPYWQWPNSSSRPGVSHPAREIPTFSSHRKSECEAMQSLKVVDWKMIIPVQKKLRLWCSTCFFSSPEVYHAHRRIITSKPNPSPIRMRDSDNKMLWVCQILPVKATWYSTACRPDASCVGCSSKTQLVEKRGSSMQSFGSSRYKKGLRSACSKRIQRALRHIKTVSNFIKTYCSHNLAGLEGKTSHLSIVPQCLHILWECMKEHTASHVFKHRPKCQHRSHHANECSFLRMILHTFYDFYVAGFCMTRGFAFGIRIH